MAWWSMPDLYRRYVRRQLHDLSNKIGRPQFGQFGASFCKQEIRGKDLKPEKVPRQIWLFSVRNALHQEIQT